MNPNEITFDIEAMGLSEMMTTGNTAEMTKEIEETLQAFIVELASIQPIPNRVIIDRFIPPRINDGEKSSGLISEINIANIL